MAETDPRFVERSERTLLLRACPYRLTQPRDEDRLSLYDGHAVSVNVSQEGMLLLMSQEPPPTRVFEVLAPASAAASPSPSLVEVRWSRPVAVDEEVQGWLVGVRFLLHA